MHEAPRLAPDRLHRYLVARELASGHTVLDFACGEGDGSALLADVAGDVVGVERSSEAVEHAAGRQARPNLRFVLGSSAAIPFPDRSVDLAVSFEPIETDSSMSAAEALIRELKRVLRPQGSLIVSIPDKYMRLQRNGNPVATLAGLLDRDELKALIAEHFAHSALYLQRIVHRSRIAKNDGNGLITNGDNANRQPTPGYSGLTSAYWIAVASDAALPPGVARAMEKPVEAFIIEPRPGSGSPDEVLVNAISNNGKHAHVPDAARHADACDREILALDKALRERENDIAALKRKLARSEQHVIALREELRLHGVRVSKFRDEALEVSNLRGQIRVFENSRSWRFTAPLRFIGRVVRRLRHEVHPEGSLRLPHANRRQTEGKVEADDAPMRREFPPNQVYPMRFHQSEPLAVPDDPPEVRAIAFYLPQYHSNPENDAWWGRGFTDWDNVRAARPLFTNHDLPRLPSELGFYDLSIKETIERQAALIRFAGLEGVCIYYYWFNGKRLLEKPLELIYENKDIDLKYCLCWANENWTRAWDGSDDDVLITQSYSESDDREFIENISKYLTDERYIRVAGRPLLVLYRVDMLPEPRESIARWRQYCLERGIGEIYVMVAEVADGAPDHYGADGSVEFPPHRLSGPAFNGVRDVHGLSPLFDGGIHDYNEMVARSVAREPNPRVARTVTMAWDNSARRSNGEPTIFINATPARYERWLSRLCRDAKSKDPEERLVFVNAWNEWAEGVYLEPDRNWGYAFINATRRAVSRCDATIPRIAVIVHLFYWDLVDELADYVSNIPFPFDLFVTATEGIYPQAFSYFNQRFPDASVNVIEVENRARDIGPFLTKFASRYYDYELLCKVHSKKSPHAPNLTGWRTFLLERILGSETRVREIVNEFARDPELGLVYPTYYPEIRSSISWGKNFHNTKRLLSSLGIELNPKSPCAFPAGSMFWFRPQALSTLLDFDFLIEEFPEETGQTDGTLAHAIERSFLFVVDHNNHRHKAIG